VGVAVFVSCCCPDGFVVYCGVFFYWWRSLEKSPLTRAQLETGKTGLSGPDYFEPREGPS